jgi:chemotaxis protein MotB
MAEENQDPIGDGTEEPSDAAVQEPEALDEGEAEEPKDKKKKKLECPACEAGAPAWMATFADMATLLMGVLRPDSLVYRNGRSFNHQNA